MVKKVSLKITDDSYKELVSLGDFYKLDVKDVITSILDGIGWHASHRIIELSKEYKVPMKLDSVVGLAFEAGFDSIYFLFNKVLENLEAKGLYRLEEFNIDLDKYTMFFYYVALRGCNLQIDDFQITLEPGIVALSTSSLIEAAKVDDKALRKLKKIVQGVELPIDIIEYLEDSNIEIKEEEIWDLKIHCTAESLNYLPSIKRISKFVEQIFKKAGIRKQE